MDSVHSSKRRCDSGRVRGWHLPWCGTLIECE
jgi:hypothetical protein